MMTTLMTTPRGTIIPYESDRKARQVLYFHLYFTNRRSSRYNVCMHSRYLVVANWKLHPRDAKTAKKIFLSIKDAASKARYVETVVCPPYVFLSSLHDAYKGTKVTLGGQDVFYEEEGAHTGAVSAPMLASMGAKWTIIGHSECRERGDNNKQVAKKVKSALAAGLTIILCVGEKARDHDGAYFTFIRDEIISALDGVTSSQLSQLVIAYEPIWAIGGRAGNACTPEMLHEMTIYIKKVLTERYNNNIAKSVRILYGGSVKPDNAETLLQRGFADGFLVGSASVVPAEFAAIIATAQNLKKSL